MVKNSWEHFLGLFWWIFFLILMSLKITGLVDLEWIQVFMPLIIPIIITIFVFIICAFLCVFVGFLIFGTFVVFKVLEKIK